YHLRPYLANLARDGAGYGGSHSPRPSAGYTAGCVKLVAPGYLPVVDHLTNHSHHCPGTTAADLAGLWVEAKDHYGYALLFLSYSRSLCRWPGGSGARATQPLAQYACLTLAN